MLRDIGFYTLTDWRAKHVSRFSPMWRCELLVTDRCNFACGYCRGLDRKYKGDIPLNDAKKIIDAWGVDGLKNIRFSGGEPTLHPALSQMVEHAREAGARVALSTNGSAQWGTYEALISAGVTDFSVSLDACCAAGICEMAGCEAPVSRITDNIRALARRVYTTVGVVVTDANLPDLQTVIRYASELGVADIRVISAAQDNRSLAAQFASVPESVLRAHPILRYRARNAASGRLVRGLRESDSHACPLVLDDSAVVGGCHFPCIIYLREGGAPIGAVADADTMRRDREAWCHAHDTHKDPICRGNCLDVCVDYNNAVANR